VEMLKQQEEFNTSSGNEPKRKLRSLSTDEVIDLLEQGIQEFHNGGARHRTIIGIGFMVSYTTAGLSRKNKAAACWMYDFAKWCKGYVKDSKRYIKDGKGGYEELDA